MEQPFYIYGAGIVAAGIYTAVKVLYQQVPVAFLVSDLDGNPSEIDGISVMQMPKVGTSDNIFQNTKILIAVPVVYHSSITERLYALGVSEEQIIVVDNQINNRLMEQYYRIRSKITVEGLLNTKGAGALDFHKVKEIDERNDMFVCQVKCNIDKPLKNAAEPPAYVIPVQAGADPDDQVIAEFRDNQGENISFKNRNYCELTVSYYAWKNSHAAYKGLCHYRRIFDISMEQMQKLLQYRQEWDVILPYPSVHFPDISSQHNRYIKENDWQTMLQALQEKAPEYHAAYEEMIFSKQQYFYNYNMLIAKSEVFDDYCRFIFSVLSRTEELATPKGWERSDRFAGYLGENLTTLYFTANRDKLKIIHTGIIWLT